MTALLVVATDTGLRAQSDFFNQRDDQYRLLGLKRAKEAYDVARRDYERQQELYRRQLISEDALEQSRRAFSDAEVNYQQSLLAVVFEEQYISVPKAIKFQGDDGHKHVRLTVANTSGGTEEFQQLLDMKDELFRSLQPDIIHNVYVSLLNDDGAVISQPYEAKIDELHNGSPQDIDFQLLQDLDAVTVMMIYGSGSQRSMKLFLQKDASVNRVLVQSEQFSQEIELGASARFDLTLELFSGTDNTFTLMAVNLPRAVNRYFAAADGSARLSQVKFTESGRTKDAALHVSLPDRPTEQVVMDQSIPFYVLVVPRDRMNEVGDPDDRRWTEEELKKLDIGYVRLELIPRGRGEILVRSPQLFHSIRPGESVEMFVDIVNEGSHSLDNAEVRADMPIGWTREIDPQTIPRIEIGTESRVNLTFTPPSDVPPGKYEVRLRTSATSNSEPVNGLDKTVTVEVRPETNVFGTLAIVLVLIALIGGIVVFGVRLSRR